MTEMVCPGACSPWLPTNAVRPSADTATSCGPSPVFTVPRIFAVSGSMVTSVASSLLRTTRRPVPWPISTVEASEARTTRATVEIRRGIAPYLRPVLTLDLRPLLRPLTANRGGLPGTGRRSAGDGPQVARFLTVGGRHRTGARVRIEAMTAVVQFLTERPDTGLVGSLLRHASIRSKRGT